MSLNASDDAIVQHAPSPSLPHISPPQTLDLRSQSSENWKLWKQKWLIYSVITKLESQSEHYRIALFLHSVGEQALRIYNGFKYGDGEDQNKLDTLIAKFDQHIIGQTNETYERYVFNKRDQSSSETIDSYVTALRTLAKTCNFCDCLNDSLLRDRIVLGIRDQDSRKRLLQDSKLTLKQCIDVCKAREATATRLKAMTDSPDEVNRVTQNKPHRFQGNKGTHTKFKGTPGKPHTSCKFCGRSHPMKKEECPAWGKTCHNCGVKNHFGNKCTNKSRSKVHSVQPHADSQTHSDSSDSEYVLGVKSMTNSDSLEHKSVHAEMMVNDLPVRFQVDCGATVNVLPQRLLKTHVELTPCDNQLQMWNNTALVPLGKCRVILRNPKLKKKYSVEFCIVKEDLIPILGKRASEQMGLIQINYKQFNSVASVVTPSVTPESILDEFSDLFNGDLGCLPGEVHLHIDDTVTPHTSPPGRIPVALAARVKTELKRLENLKVIAPIDIPTDWNSRMVVATKKSGDLRICLDPRPLNQALKRERFQLPIMDEILPKLSKAKVFSKLDLSSGYWHVKLDYESSLLTTFQTPLGRYRWLRLPFGTNVSSEIFQRHLILALDGLEGTLCMSDDILVYGSGDNNDDAQVDHNTNLRKLLQRCREKGIKLNRDKVDICKEELKFLGHLITRDGLRADPDKIEAIVKLNPPTSVEEVQRLNGTVNYLAKFLPHLSEVMEPIRQLTRKDTPWEWTNIRNNAFIEVKKLVTQIPLLNFYDPDADLVIQCDASEKGLGAALLQHGKPVAYASRALTGAETRYAQIEKEMLAVVFSLEKFHQYTFGRQTTVDSDHKPLESIQRKPLAKAPKRLQGMLLRALQYDIEIHYRKGKDMHIADMLSRAYLPDSSNNQSEFERVNMVAFLPIRDERLQEIRRATEHDDVTQELRNTILRGWPDDKGKLSSQLTPYFHIRDELSVQDGLIFKGERVVIPHSLRSDIKKSIHSSHIGTDGCLRRARECVFWPGMSADIRQYISTCETCRKFEIDQPKETLMSHDLPDRPWEKIGVDLFHFDDKEYLVTVDYFSNFWEIDVLDNTTTSTVIRTLKRHFARYGIPCQIVSDPGPQFNSLQFNEFSIKWGFEHLLVSPANQKANGKAESAVKSAKRLLRKSKDSHADPFLALLDFRNTPTQGVGSSPAQRLMNRRTRTMLPLTRNLLKPQVRHVDLDKSLLKRQQDKQARYYNRGARDLPNLSEGDTVRMRPYIKGTREWRKAIVTKRLDERSYQVETPEGSFRRNRTHLRKTSENPPSHVESTSPKEPTTDSPIIEPEIFAPQVQQDTPPNASGDSRSDAMPTTEIQTTSRSGRILKTPTYLKDFVTS